MTGGFGTFVSSLVATIVLVHDHRGLLLRLQLVESLVELHITELLLDLVMSSSVWILPVTAEPMDIT